MISVGMYSLTLYRSNRIRNSSLRFAFATQKHNQASFGCSPHAKVDRVVLRIAHCSVLIYVCPPFVSISFNIRFECGSVSEHSVDLHFLFTMLLIAMAEKINLFCSEPRTPLIVLLVYMAFFNNLLAGSLGKIKVKLWWGVTRRLLNTKAKWKYKEPYLCGFNEWNH